MNAYCAMKGKGVLAAAAVGLVLLAGATAAPPQPPIKAGDYTITGPYGYRDLTVFLIRGPDRLQGKSYLTLQEALEKKIVIVHETGNVSELSVENVSRDQDVYIQSGDIVKGGRQDRTIAMDFIVPPHSGKMPINAFCVEHGRWQARGGEAASHFGSSENSLSGRELRLAAKRQADQSAVWQEVTTNQAKLAVAVSQPVTDARSPSSFELSLESKPVQDHVNDYVQSLQKTIDGQNDVIGYAFAINGKINSADIYASHELFAKLWPKLLRSSAVEAVADLRKDGTSAAARADDVRACILDSQAGKRSEKDVTPRVQVVTQETDRNVVFVTRDREAGDSVVHENYVNKK